MNNTGIQMILARRATLTAQYNQLIKDKNYFAAGDMLADLRFVNRQANDALMGR